MNSLLVLDLRIILPCEFEIAESLWAREQLLFSLTSTEIEKKLFLIKMSFPPQNFYH